MMSGKAGLGQIFKTILHYAYWYPRQWVYLSRWGGHAKVTGHIRNHIRFIEKTSHKLARNLFHSMAIHQQGLEKRQQILFRYVNIGTDLFAMACACSRASYLTAQNPSDTGPDELADLFCREATLRIKREFHAQKENDDKMIYRLGRNFMEGKYQWLETGIVK
jgi:hypothetical protein